MRPRNVLGKRRAPGFSVPAGVNTQESGRSIGLAAVPSDARRIAAVNDELGTWGLDVCVRCTQDRLGELSAAKTRSPRVRFLSDQGDDGPSVSAAPAAASASTPHTPPSAQRARRSTPPLSLSRSMLSSPPPDRRSSLPLTPATSNVTGYGTQKGSLTDRYVSRAGGMHASLPLCSIPHSASSP